MPSACLRLMLSRSDCATNERAHEILALTRVEKRHVYNDDIDSDLLGQKAPLLLYLLVVPPETVDAQNVQQVALAQAHNELGVLRTDEVPARLLIHKNVLLRNVPGSQSQQLPVFVLIGARHASVAVCLHMITLI